MQNALRCGISRLSIAIVVLGTVGFAPGMALAADPVVSNVSFSVRGNEHITLVDVTFTLADADGDACWLHLWGHDAAINTTEAAEATGRVYYPMCTFLRDGVFIESERFAPGTHTLTWLASVDCEETAPIAASQFQAFVRASDRGRIAPGRFCVIDVSSGPSSPSYPVQYVPYVDVFQDACKTDKIVLRELPNGSWMGVYEVTQRQYQRVTGLTPSSAANKPTRPVEMITWNEITGSGNYKSGFIAALRSKTGLSLLNLPDETLWGFACRAGTTSYYTDYAEGATLGAKTVSSLGKMGWYSDNSSGRTHTVGMKRPNPWGLFDMHGNVWEWTTTYNWGYVKRGGSWFSPADDCYPGGYYTSADYGDYRNSNRGFRLALPSGSSSALAGIHGEFSTSNLLSVNARPDVLKDFNGNGIPDAFEDFDGNGSFNAFEDFNGNSLPDAFEDFNGNGLPDAFEDLDGNLVPDFFQDLHPIRSSSHPTFLYCYFNAPATARFDWPNYRPSAANGFLYMLNQIPQTQITLANGDYTSSRSLARKGLSHGNWYLHLVALNASNQIIPESLERFGVRVSTADPGVWSLSHPKSQTPTLLRDFEAVIFPPANADAASVVRYYYTVSQSPTTPVTKTDTSTDVPHVVVPNNALGSNWFHIAAEDRLGNLSAVAHYGFIVAEVPPRIWSPTHPDPAKEYGLREPTLAWAPPEGFPTGNVGRYYYILDSEPLTIPTQQSDATTETLRAFSAQQPGSSYFHLCYEDRYGHLSPAAHFRFNIRDKHLPPVISSSTHPNPGVAYPQREATFAWTDPENLSTQYRYILDQSSSTEPSTDAPRVDNPPLHLDGLPVGTNWLHLQSLNRYGVWSDTSHYKVNIRATRPPVVTSSTHPNPNQAYGRNPAFEWTDPDGRAVQYFYEFNTFPDMEPNRESPSTTDRFRNYVGLSDGVYYFHVRAEDIYGDLTQTTHFRVVVVCCVPTATPTFTPTASPTPTPSPTSTPTPSLTPTPTPHPQAPLIAILLGENPTEPESDRNGDGVLDIADLLWALNQ